MDEKHTPDRLEASESMKKHKKSIEKHQKASKNMKFNTKTIHGGQEHDPSYGSVMPPIYQTSTYSQTTPGGHKGFEYSRTHNPTRSALEKSFASIENGKYGLAFGSGLAAIDAVMKLLNEFMAQKYITTKGASIACTRPSVVFGYGRKRSSLMWAEEFATNPALGKTLNLPFPQTNKDNFIYVEDCAEQLIELSLKEKLNHFVYNSGSETVSGKELKEILISLIPDAKINFDENGSPTPFIDCQDDQRIRKELSLIPKTLKQGIKEHMNEARFDHGLELLQ